MFILYHYISLQSYQGLFTTSYDYNSNHMITTAMQQHMINNNTASYDHNNNTIQSGLLSASLSSHHDNME